MDEIDPPKKYTPAPAPLAPILNCILPCVSIPAVAVTSEPLFLLNLLRDSLALKQCNLQSVV